MVILVKKVKKVSSNHSPEGLNRNFCRKFYLKSQSCNMLVRILGSGCGCVGRAYASNTRGLQFNCRAFIALPSVLMKWGETHYADIVGSNPGTIV